MANVVNMNDYKNRHLSVPPRQRHVTNIVYKVKSLKVYATFTVPLTQANSLRVCMSMHKRAYPHKRFVTWTVGDRVRIKRLANGRAK